MICRQCYCCYSCTHIHNRSMYFVQILFQLCSYNFQLCSQFQKGENTSFADSRLKKKEFSTSLERLFSPGYTLDYFEHCKQKNQGFFYFFSLIGNERIFFLIFQYMKKQVLKILDFEMPGPLKYAVLYQIKMFSRYADFTWIFEVQGFYVHFTWIFVLTFVQILFKFILLGFY